MAGAVSTPGLTRVACSGLSYRPLQPAKRPSLVNALCPVVNTKLGEDRLQVGFHGVFSQVQALADAFVGEALSQQGQYLPLPWRQGKVVSSESRQATGEVALPLSHCSHHSHQ